MARDQRYDILFEPVAIGPVTAKNRFYQPPHCNGMGQLRPHMHAAMRAVKAEGGWAVVHTEHVSIHPTSDMLGEVVQVLWDDDDIPALALMADAVHEHGALAGIQLAYGAYEIVNRFTREVPMGPEDLPVSPYDPVQARAMDKDDIRALLGWQAAAAKRSRSAGFDIVQVDANFSTAPFQFLSPRNRRGDEYGGSLENRARLLRELIEVTKDAVGESCAVTVRLIIDELIGPRGLTTEDEGKAVIAYLAELPDLWDIVIGTWAGDSPSSRFAPEAVHEPHLAGLKGLTTKPVVGVGRFTSPDTMAAQVRRGILDMIGGTRPSIADPFLPQKIEEGRIDDIRECIGCNICASNHFAGTPIRCTQNPTMGEEWRKGWHPERMPPKGSGDSILVIGAGPAGLECARALGQRGYAVHLAEAGRELGGRVSREARLPGLAEWARVRDWRLGQLDKLANVAIYRESRLTAPEVLELGFDHVVVATGARWRRDGRGRATQGAIEGSGGDHVLTPDDVIDGARPEGPVLVFDDDHYYMASVMAEVLRGQGLEVTLATPAAEVAAWTEMTLELERIHRRLDELGIHMVTHHTLAAIAPGKATLNHVHTEKSRSIAAASVVLVSARVPEDSLYRALASNADALSQAGIKSLSRIGDCNAPGAIVHAVYDGHRWAQALDADAGAPAVRRERPVVMRAGGAGVAA